jgi:hypothetical protein
MLENPATGRSPLNIIPRRAAGRISAGDVEGFLAVLVLASLFVPNGSYPVVLRHGSAALRLQDLLFAAVIVVAAGRWRSLGREHRRALLLLTPFLVLIALSAIRSPAGEPAVVAVAKIAEFVLGGFAAVWLLRASRLVPLATAALALGTLVNAVDALGVLASDGGLHEVVTDRAHGFIGTDVLATAAGATAIWCYGRWMATRSGLERGACLVGFAAALLAFIAAKSFVGVVSIAAVAAISPALSRRAVAGSAVAAALVLAVLAGGRLGDVLPVVKSPAPGTPREAAGGTPPAPRVPVSRGAKSPIGVAPDPYSKPSREAPGAAGGSLTQRIALGYVGLRLAAGAPWLGHGWLQSSDPVFLRSGPYDRYMLQRFPTLDPKLLVSTTPTQLHSAYIQMAAEAGVLAVVALIVLLAYYVARTSAAVWSRRRAADWHSVVGLGWLLLVGLFLATNALFGGSFECALLGGAVAAGSVEGLPGVPPRQLWLVGAGVLVLAAVGVAVIVPLGKRATPPPDATVRVSDGSAEVFAAGHRFTGPGGSTLANGLVELRARRDGLVLADVGNPDASLRVEAGVEPPADPPRLVERTGDAATLLYRSRSPAAPPVLVTLVRGVPGVYVTSPAQYARSDRPAGVRTDGPSLVVAHGPALAQGRQLDVVPRRIRAFEPLAAIAPGRRALGVVIPFDSTGVLAPAPDRAGVFVSQPRGLNGVAFVGLVPLRGAGAGATRFELREPGAYALLRRATRTWSPLQVRPGGRLVRARAVVPLELAGRLSFGLREIATFAFHFCPLAESFRGASTVVGKDQRGRALTRSTPCYAYAGSRRRVVRLASSGG